ncbi:helix-turn-helix domain-containing protein [uncultured Parasphingorhabdus sp.]|uniref:helix-turn-helix domain-containing protein n=1 Tax=uncultured Parasphingorhabdus sp. TaxID=2709694 RepID=UPI0030DC6D1D|tara:strand:- start:8476 stop:8682 length:207 start_codon:yes stop_codon:yes gene_type:complete
MMETPGKPSKPEICPITVRIPVAVQMTGIGRSKLYELIGAGEIETIKLGSSRLILVSSLQDFIDRRRL